MKKGIFFTLDAVFALLALLSIVSLFTLVSLESVSTEFMHESLHSLSGDMIGMSAKLYLRDLWSEKTVRDIYYGGYVNDKDLNETVLEVYGALWALNDSNYTSAAQNLTKLVFSNMVPVSVNWALTMGNDTLYNTTSLDSTDVIVTISRRLVSGYMKSEPHVGYLARAFLSNVVGNQASQYFFFGGFVGQGNMTAVVRNIPSDANISYIYMEMNIQDNFTLYINSKYCGTFNKTSAGVFSVDSWTIKSSLCLSNLTRGSPNYFNINFTGSNVSAKYVGGGYIKVVYNTALFGDEINGVQRYYFPGIDGVVNLYDSFYVPGTMKNITAYIKIYNNYTTALTIGNKTVYNQNGTNLVQQIYLYDQNFTLLDYSKLGQVTVPLRLQAGANITGGTMGDADVILITDNSGSMDWELSADTSGNQWGNNCADPRMFSDPTTQKLALAKCLDKYFIDIVLNGSGNRLGLVSFNDAVINWTSLSTSKTYLNTTVNNYVQGGGTCICCAINQAQQILKAQSDNTKLKFIVVMTDGIAGYRCQNVGSCYWWSGDTSSTTYPLYDVSFFNSTMGFAVGQRRSGGVNYGRIMQWKNGAWSVFLNLNPILYGVKMQQKCPGLGRSYQL